METATAPFRIYCMFPWIDGLLVCSDNWRVDYPLVVTWRWSPNARRSTASVKKTFKKLMWGTICYCFKDCTLETRRMSSTQNVDLSKEWCGKDIIKRESNYGGQRERVGCGWGNERRARLYVTRTTIDYSAWLERSSVFFFQRVCPHFVQQHRSFYIKAREASVKWVKASVFIFFRIIIR